MSADYLGWHFLARRGFLRDGKPALESGIESTTDEAILCESGLHASADALAALSYAPGTVVRRVRLLAPVTKDGDKAVSHRREVLWTADADVALRLFAADCAESVWHLIPDEPSKIAATWAIDVARRFAQGEADEEERAAARAAAWDAARAAAWDAAGDAARDAAWDAAGDAARDAAWDAARAAAWDAARDAAWDAAWDAARDAQNKNLTHALLALEPK
jgi:hypothetical protein